MDVAALLEQIVVDVTTRVEAGETADTLLSRICDKPTLDIFIANCATAIVFAAYIVSQKHPEFTITQLAHAAANQGFLYGYMYAKAEMDINVMYKMFDKEGE